MSKIAVKTEKKAPKTTIKAPKTLEIGEKKPKIAAKPEEKVSEVTEQPAEPEFQYEHISILALSRMFNIDRQTIRDRIEKAGIKPVKIAVNEKLYALDENLEMIIRQDELAEAKLEKLRAEIELKEHELAIKRGEYASVAEFTEVTQKIFGRLHKRVVVQLPKRIAKRLHESNSSAELAQILETELAKEFNDLRSDFKKFL